MEKIHPPSYLNKEPKAQSGVTIQFCELSVNNRYKAFYLLSEQVGRKLLRLTKEDHTGGHGELFQGAAYQGVVTFDSVPLKKNTLDIGEAMILSIHTLMIRLGITYTPLPKL